MMHFCRLDQPRGYKLVKMTPALNNYLLKCSGNTNKNPNTSNSKTKTGTIFLHIDVFIFILYVQFANVTKL